MKKFHLFVAMIFFITSLMAIGQTAENYTDSCLSPTGEKITFSYMKCTLPANDWLVGVVSDMQKKMGSTDWYMATYSGGIISLIHRGKENYESYDLIPVSVKDVFYDYYFLISLRLIELKVASGQSIIISNTEEVLKKMAPHLKTLRHIEELAKFQKP